MLNNSKTDYEKKLLNLRRKRLAEVEIEDFVTADDSSDESENDEKNVKDPQTIQAYSMYITEVISAFVFDSNPSVDMQKMLPNIKESASKVVKITKRLIEVSSRSGELFVALDT